MHCFLVDKSSSKKSRSSWHKKEEEEGEHKGAVTFLKHQQYKHTIIQQRLLPHELFTFGHLCCEEKDQKKTFLVAISSFTGNFLVLGIRQMLSLSAELLCLVDFYHGSTRDVLDRTRLGWGIAFWTEMHISSLKKSISTIFLSLPWFHLNICRHVFNAEKRGY